MQFKAKNDWKIGEARSYPEAEAFQKHRDTDNQTNRQTKRHTNTQTDELARW